jgi:H-type lectin domain
MDVRPWYIPRTKTKGTATFHQKFESIPRVLAAVNWLDISNRANLRLKLEIRDVSTKGLIWHLDTWDSTVLYSAGASYIAILDS